MAKGLLSAGVTIVSLLSTAAAYANSGVVDPDAAIIYLRFECDGDPMATPPIPPIDDCFEEIDAAEDWTWGYGDPPHRAHKPDADHRLLWDIGPGEWAEEFDCRDGEGFLTLQGAGRLHTIISGDPSDNPDGQSVGGRVEGGCQRLDFRDLRFTGTDAGFSWTGNGTSTWSNVDIVGTETAGGGGTSYAWVDQCSAENPSNGGLHYFFGSRFQLHDKESTADAAVVRSECSESWIFGSELNWTITQDGPIPPGSAAVNVSGVGDVRLFGATIFASVTVESDSGASAGDGELIAVRLENDDPEATAPTAFFHMHGGLIRAVVENGQALDAVGVSVDGLAMAHSPDTAYDVSSPDGTSTRIRTSGGMVMAPFHWHPAETPPDTKSIDGSDMYVEVDCDSLGDCTAGTANHWESHLMVYNEKCGEDPTGTPWFDQVTGKCREK